jgi:competence protein ComEC
MKALLNVKIASISLALLFAISGCSSNSVPITSPTNIDASKQSQTQEQQDTTAIKDTPPTPAATTPTVAPAVIVAPPAVAPAPASQPIITPAPVPKQTPQAVAVFVTKTGAKYHRDGCRYLSKSKISISLSDAKSGYGPCSVCNPPQ